MEVARRTLHCRLKAQIATTTAPEEISKLCDELSRWAAAPAAASVEVGSGSVGAGATKQDLAQMLHVEFQRVLSVPSSFGGGRSGSWLFGLRLTLVDARGPGADVRAVPVPMCARSWRRCGGLACCMSHVACRMSHVASPAQNEALHEQLCELRRERDRLRTCQRCRKQ